MSVTDNEKEILRLIIKANNGSDEARQELSGLPEDQWRELAIRAKHPDIELPTFQVTSKVHARNMVNNFIKEGVQPNITEKIDEEEWEKADFDDYSIENDDIGNNIDGYYLMADSPKDGSNVRAFFPDLVDAAKNSSVGFKKGENNEITLATLEELKSDAVTALNNKEDDKIEKYERMAEEHGYSIE